MPIDFVPLENTQDTARSPCQDVRDVVGLGWRKSHEVPGAMRWADVDAVEDERMEVRRQVEGRTEALDERDRAALPLANPEKRSRATPLFREDGSQEAAQDFAREPRIPG